MDFKCTFIRTSRASSQQSYRQYSECSQKRMEGDEFYVFCISSQHWTQCYTSTKIGNCWCGYRNNLYRIFHALYPDLLYSNIARHKAAKEYFIDNETMLNGTLIRDQEDRYCILCEQLT